MLSNRSKDIEWTNKLSEHHEANDIGTPYELTSLMTYRVLLLDF